MNQFKISTYEDFEKKAIELFKIQHKHNQVYNKYCSDNFIKNLFTTDGMMISGQKIIMNTGLIKTIDDLFNFDYL